MALVSLSDVETYLGLTAGNAYETRLSALINGVSARIETICSRHFSAADQVEHATIFRTQQRYGLRRPPVQKVNAVLWGRANAILVAYSGAAVNATIQVRPNDVVLTTIATTGLSTSTIISFTSAGTTDLLATAIAAVSGFTATVYATGIPSRWLFPEAAKQLKFAGQTCSLPLSYPNVPFFEYSVDFDNSVLAFAPWSSVNYFFVTDKPTGPIRFPEAYQMLTVDYRGGYEVIPEDVKMIACELVAMQFNMSRKDTSVNSEHLRDYGYTTNWADTDRTIRSRLADYIAIPIAGGLG